MKNHIPNIKDIDNKIRMLELLNMIEQQEQNKKDVDKFNKDFERTIKLREMIY